MKKVCQKLGKCLSAKITRTRSLLKIHQELIRTCGLLGNGGNFLEYHITYQFQEINLKNLQVLSAKTKKFQKFFKNSLNFF